MRGLVKRDHDLLMLLFYVRYLSTHQIHEQFFQDKTIELCRKRLKRMVNRELLVEVKKDHYHFSWSLGPRGYDYLQHCYDVSFDTFKPMKIQFLDHLHATNQICLTLLGDDETIVSAPFTWLGSHKINIPFIDKYRDHNGVYHRVNRNLIPDAVCTPQDQRLPRIFIELDRGTQPIRKRQYQTSILHSLESYHTVLHPTKHNGSSFYQTKFTDNRPAMVLYVIDKVGIKRKENIEHVYKEHNHRFCFDLQTCMLTDKSQLRALCLGDATTDHVACIPPDTTNQAHSSRDLTTGEFDAFKSFYHHTITTIKANDVVVTNQDYIASAKVMKKALHRLGEVFHGNHS